MKDLNAECTDWGAFWGPAFAKCKSSLTLPLLLASCFLAYQYRPSANSFARPPDTAMPRAPHLLL